MVGNLLETFHIIPCVFRTGNWRVFTGNELGALLGWWSVQYYKEMNPGKDLSNCYLLASTVSSKMLKSMSLIDGFNFEETLTGFKWMANRSVELIKQGKDVLFAFEEAIGFMFTTNVLDKDGVSASGHLATMASYLKQTEDISLSTKLDQLYKQYGYHYTINSYYLCYEPKTIVKIFERIRNFDGAETVSGFWLLNEWLTNSLFLVSRLSARRQIQNQICARFDHR